MYAVFIFYYLLLYNLNKYFHPALTQALTLKRRHIVFTQNCMQMCTNKTFKHMQIMWHTLTMAPDDTRFLRKFDHFNGCPPRHEAVFPSYLIINTSSTNRSLREAFCNLSNLILFFLLCLLTKH